MIAEYSPSSAKRSEHFTKPKPLTTQRKKTSKNKRRFSEEQIKSLESIFKQETKLDQRTKAKVARELGLQPRQVAIWFQNKRARWKSKQIEQDHRILKADYDSLNSHFESLKREKQSLLIQLQKLRELQKCHCDGDKESKNWEENAAAEMSYDKDIALEFKAKQNCSNEELDSGDAKEQNSGYLGQEEESDPQNQCEQEDASVTPPAKWSNFELSGFLDESCEPSNWWDFWT